MYNPDEILADPNAHPVHKKYAEINIGVRDRGERWAKCLNCGEPFQVGESLEFCSDECGDEFSKYLLSDKW